MTTTAITPLRQRMVEDRGATLIALLGSTGCEIADIL
jgi:hypothetical protein